MIQQDDEETYIAEAAKAWMNLPDVEISSPEGKIALGEQLMHHSFMQAMISFMKGNYYQVSAIIDELKVNYPALKEMKDPEEVVNALLALISYARTGTVESQRPFLNVQVQLWMRELRRLVAKVTPKMVYILRSTRFEYATGKAIFACSKLP